MTRRETPGGEAEARTGETRRNLRVVYYVGRFPSVSQTFIVNQIADMTQRGHEVALYAFRRGDTSVPDDTIRRHGLMERTTFAPSLPASRAGRMRAAIRALHESPLGRRILRETISPRRFGWSEVVPFRRIVWGLDIARHMTDFQPDILHVHFGFNAMLPMCVQKAGVRPSARMLVTLHGFDLHRYSTDDYREIFRHAQGFTVNSGYTAERAVALGCPPEKIVRLPVGLDCARYIERGARNQARTQPVRILYVGRLVEFKGIDIAIRSVARLRELCEADIRFTIVGEGEMRGVAEQLVDELGLRDSVAFRGVVSRQETIDCFADADIFLFPGVTARDGRQENQGLVIQEAQAMEVPVVVCDVGGVAEGVLPDETGYVLPERDIEGIAAALCRLACHPEERRRMGRRGRRFVEARYDSRVLGARLEEIYRSLRRGDARRAGELGTPSGKEAPAW